MKNSSLVEYFKNGEKGNGHSIQVVAVVLDRDTSLLGTRMKIDLFIPDRTSVSLEKNDLYRVVADEIRYTLGQWL